MNDSLNVMIGFAGIQPCNIVCSCTLLDTHAVAGIWGMPVGARWELYHQWCREYHSALTAELTDLLKRHTELSARLAVSSCPTLQPFDVIRSTSLLC